MGERSCKRAEMMIEELLDDRLDEPGRKALDEHLQRCETCQGYREAAVYALNALGAQPLPSPTDQALDRMWQKLDRRLDAAEPDLNGMNFESPSPAKVLSFRAVVGASLAIAAALAAVAFGLFWVWPPEPEGSVAERPGSPTQAAEDRAEPPAVVEEAAPPFLLLASGEAEVRRGEAGELLPSAVEARLQDRDEVRTSDESLALFRRGDEVRLAVGPGSTFDVEHSTGDALEVSLTSGWLTGRVDPSDEPLEVRVDTPAGMLRVLGTIFAVELGESDEVEVRVARGEVAFQPNGAHPSVTVSSGQVVSFPEGRIAAASAHVVSRDEALLEGRLLPPSEDVAVGISVENLFERAEAARRRGQLRRAASMYRRIASVDRGAAGGTALISYGQLSLGPLGQPAQARQAFSSYLTSGRRSLRQEAFVGLLRAQRALGQTSGARSTARRYLGEYPSGRYRTVAEELLR